MLFAKLNEGTRQAMALPFDERHKRKNQVPYEVIATVWWYKLKHTHRHTKHNVISILADCSLHVSVAMCGCVCARHLSAHIDNFDPLLLVFCVYVRDTLLLFPPLEIGVLRLSFILFVIFEEGAR